MKLVERRMLSRRNNNWIIWDTFVSGPKGKPRYTHTTRWISALDPYIRDNIQPGSEMPPTAEQAA